MFHVARTAREHAFTSSINGTGEGRTMNAKGPEVLVAGHINLKFPVYKSPTFGGTQILQL
jgi:hypothetical protein